MLQWECRMVKPLTSNLAVRVQQYGCRNTIQRLPGSNNRKLLLAVVGDGKAKIEVPADLL